MNDGVDLGKIKQHIKTSGACKWNVEEPGIKIFFDVTPVSSMLRPGSTDKSLFGVGISLVAMLTNRVLHSVNHVGFILSDGSIIHATTGKGVVRESGNDIVNNPRNYIIVNVGGSESDLISKFEQLKKTLYVDQDSYDWKGIVRQVPLIGKLLARFKWSENKPYRFFCSELVANLLVRTGIINYNQLVNIHEKLTGLDKYDEVDPTKLFLLIKDKAELCPVICDTNLNKENIMTKNELKQIIAEAIQELREEASTKELQKLGYKPTKSDVNEAGGYEDGIKDAKDRMKYVALRKMEKDHLAKSKITKDIKKQHHLDMADKYLQQALDIVKKHGVVDEGKMNETKGFRLHWNSPESHYMMKNGVMKNKSGVNTRTIKYDDLVKIFPQSKDIVLKSLPPISQMNTGDVDYFTVDGEGDVVPLTHGDIGSGLD